MLKEIATVISDAKTNIRNAEANTAEDHATVDIVADIADLKHLERILSRRAQNPRRARCAEDTEAVAALFSLTFIHTFGGLGTFGQAYDMSMDFQFTAVFRRVPEGYIAFVEELPGANTQGVTLDEARTNLQEAVALVLEANRTLAQEAASGNDVIREPLKVSA